MSLLGASVLKLLSLRSVAPRQLPDVSLEEDNILSPAPDESPQPCNGASQDCTGYFASGHGIQDQVE